MLTQDATNCLLTSTAYSKTSYLFLLHLLLTTLIQTPSSALLPVIRAGPGRKLQSPKQLSLISRSSSRSSAPRSSISSSSSSPRRILAQAPLGPKPWPHPPNLAKEQDNLNVSVLVSSSNNNSSNPADLRSKPQQRWHPEWFSPFSLSHLSSPLLS